MTNSATRAADRVGVLIHSDRPQLFLPTLESRFPEVGFVACRSYAAVEAALAETRPAVVLSHKFEDDRYPGRAVADAPSVRWIHCGGTGVDHFAPWDAARVTVTNSPGLARHAMAEYAIGGIYALQLRFLHYWRQQQRREWRRGTVRQSAGGTIAVIGLGRIGRAICARARAAGMTVLGVRSRPEPVPEADEVFASARLHEALARADYVVVILPRTDETVGLIDAPTIARMKPGALLVNLSRGGIVDEPALLDALRSGRLGGAVLDVFEEEPLPADSPFWDLETVILTPHVAGFVEGWEAGVAELFAINLGHWLAGRPLENVVDAATGY